MKFFKRLLSAGCAAVLLASAAVLPPVTASAATTDNTGWYSGDFNCNGKIDTNDARAILRMAAYMDEVPTGSFFFEKADFDHDGRITSRDARLVLRLAARLPVDGYAPDGNAKALQLLENANYLKQEQTDTGIDKIYDLKTTITTKMDGAVDMSTATKLLLGSKAGDLKDELSSPASTEVKNYTYNYYDPLYLTLNILNDDYFMALGYEYTNLSGSGIARARDLKYVFNSPAGYAERITTDQVASTSLTYNSAENTYTVRVNFKNYTITTNTASDSVVRKYGIAQIISPADLSKLAADLIKEIDMDDANVSVKDNMKVDGTRYYLQCVITNPYIEYKFNAETNRPVSATYHVSQKTSVPASMNMKLGALKVIDIDLATVTTEEYTGQYTFREASRIR
ncbi:MAG: hypothetical protein IJ766_02085 [Clostridia bacterium]|nr:hypothetical protein [Clostridia bacterium]